MDVLPMIEPLDWWDRMWDKFPRWCDAEPPCVPDGFDRGWQCYRQPGHTGRHLGIASKRDDAKADAWTVWSDRDPEASR
jgi:hypothetical protein